MRTQTFSILAVALGLINTARAHMILANPVPYGKSTLNNSPLDPSGSDFPCKQRPGVYDVTQTNDWPVGSTQTLSFTGTAVHGGGSCQVSITMDKQPTASSKWKVIHSIIGGCPGDNSMPSTFQYTIPKGIPNGDYTMAWTWFNRLGNREMYMNCAPVHVAGGADDQKGLVALPDMYLANLAITPNYIPDSQVIQFPNPGDSVQGGDGQPAVVQSSVSGKAVMGAELATGITQYSSTSTVTAWATVYAAKPKADACKGVPDGAMVCTPDTEQYALCNFGNVVWQPMAAGTKCVDGKVQYAKRCRAHRRSPWGDF